MIRRMLSGVTRRVVETYSVFFFVEGCGPIRRKTLCGSVLETEIRGKTLCGSVLEIDLRSVEKYHVRHLEEVY